MIDFIEERFTLVFMGYSDTGSQAFIELTYNWTCLIMNMVQVMVMLRWLLLICMPLAFGWLVRESI